MATTARRVTSSVIRTTRTDRPGTGSACRARGARVPSSVTKDTSTLVSSGYGLNNARYSSAPRSVLPAARYQRSDDVEAQGAALYPLASVASRSTDTVPASTSTIAATGRAGVSGPSATRRRPWAGTSTRMVCDRPSPGTTVISPAAERPPALAMTTATSVRPPGIDGPAAQNHVDDTAAAGAATGIVRRAEAEAEPCGRATRPPVGPIGRVAVVGVTTAGHHRGDHESPQHDEGRPSTDQESAFTLGRGRRHR